MTRLLTVVLVLGVCGCESKPHASSRVSSGEPPVMVRAASTTQVPHAYTNRADDMSAICREFVEQVCTRSGQEAPAVAVLPIAAADGPVTPCSDWLADQLVAAFLSTPARVVDRESLRHISAELDLGSVFDQPQNAARIARADVLVVGRYWLAAGRLTVDLKAVEVATSKVLHVDSYSVPADLRIRQLAFTEVSRGGPADGVAVQELDGAVRIRVSQVEPGASQLRLLDRARQKIRRVLGQYLRDAVGLELSADDLDERFRQGKEIDCQFGRDSVTLEMGFGARL